MCRGTQWHTGGPQGPPANLPGQGTPARDSPSDLTVHLLAYRWQSTCIVDSDMTLWQVTLRKVRVRSLSG